MIVSSWSASIAVAVVGVVWLMFVSPERKKASQAAAAAAAAEAQLQSAHSELATAREAQAKYAASYSTIVKLGKGVPTTQEVPSLINELAQASKQKKRRIRLDYGRRQRQERR